MTFEKLVVITRKTRLEELVYRFNTKAQARFYIEHSGGDYKDYEQEHENYVRSLETLRRQFSALAMKSQFVDRMYLPNFVFSASDLVIVVGQDGLVANTAKYAGRQPIIGLNPDPERYDGILVPAKVKELKAIVQMVQQDSALVREVALAQVRLNDGQKLLAFNDFFVGARSHVSARYRLEYCGRSESQSSSGIIVSTGAGSTGWLSSVFNMVSSVNEFLGLPGRHPAKMSWENPQLMFIVREPFISRHSSADIVAGRLQEGQELVIESRMPAGGTIFSDGIESDFIAFDSGCIARIGVAPERARLIVPFAGSDRSALQTAVDRAFAANK